MPAELLEQLLRLGVQPSGKDHAGDTPNVITLGEAAREPGQPVTVRFLVIVEEGNDLAGRGGYTGVAGPHHPRPRFQDVAERHPTPA